MLKQITRFQKETGNSLKENLPKNQEVLKYSHEKQTLYHICPVRHH
jgi:hypothetical protein